MDPLNKPDYTYLNVTTFITDKINIKTLPDFADGYIGLSPCPQNLKEYSFSYQLLSNNNMDGRIKSLEWRINSHFSNKKEPFSENGMLLINEEITKFDKMTKRVSSLNFTDILAK